MPFEPCVERLALADRITNAELGVQKAKADLDAAKARGIQNLIGLQSALAYARSIGRAALEAMDEHVRSHGCTVGESMNQATQGGGYIERTSGPFLNRPIRPAYPTRRRPFSEDGRGMFYEFSRISRCLRLRAFLPPLAARR